MTFTIEALGLLAGICTTLAFIPQVWQVWKTHSVKDISLTMYIIFCFGPGMWIIYGFFLKSFPLIISNIITLALALSILLMKIIWDKSS